MMTIIENNVTINNSIGVDSISNRIHFRGVQPNDFDQLKALHEELFPVKYKDSFYRDICDGLHKDYMGNDKNKNGIHTGSDQNNELQLPFTYSIVAVTNNSNPLEAEELVGFILAQMCYASTCEDTNMFSYENADDIVCYILTLGTKVSHRREKLGTKLINMCIDFCQLKPNCASVYLHVIDYNKEAIQFYKNNQFQCLRKLNEFYKIDNFYYSAYLYILYLNGRQPPLFLRFINETKNVTEFTFAYISSIFSNIIPRSINSFLTRIFSTDRTTQNNKNITEDKIERAL